MLQAVAEVHDNGICLLDIKPANIWISAGESPEQPSRVCLLDFGMAHEFVPGTPVAEPLQELLRNAQSGSICCKVCVTLQHELRLDAPLLWPHCFGVSNPLLHPFAG